MKILFNKLEEKYTGKYLTFTEQTKTLWIIENKDPELIGHLEKIRVGAWMSWCLLLEDRCYLSAGCQDEIREITKKLNATINKPIAKDETKYQ